MNAVGLARAWHSTIAGIVGLALVAQLILVVRGVTVLIPDYFPSLPVRVWQFFSYFTVQSNLLVLIGSVTLAVHPQRDGHGWRVLRLAMLIGITVTGLVYAVLLAPIVHPTGLNWLLDKALHVISPILVLAGWAIWGPRPRADVRTIGLTLAWPSLWLIYSLVVGAVRGWYPYPFLDPRPSGVGPVIIACVGITVLFVILAGLFRWLDRLRPLARIT